MAVHVYPINDWIDHHIECDEETCNCPCEPRFEYGVTIDQHGHIEPSVIIIHNRVEPEEPEPLPKWYHRIVRWYIRQLQKFAGE